MGINKVDLPLEIGPLLQIYQEVKELDTFCINFSNLIKLFMWGWRDGSISEVFKLKDLSLIPKTHVENHLSNASTGKKQTAESPAQRQSTQTAGSPAQRQSTLPV